MIRRISWIATVTVTVVYGCALSSFFFLSFASLTRASASATFVTVDDVRIRCNSRYRNPNMLLLRANTANTPTPTKAKASKAKKSNTKARARARTGFGMKSPPISSSSTLTSSSSTFDAGASVLRLEKVYDQLLREASLREQQQQQWLESEYEESERLHPPASYRVQEFVIAVRHHPPHRHNINKNAGTNAQSKPLVLPDWVPIAQLIAELPNNHHTNHNHNHNNNNHHFEEDAFMGSCLQSLVAQYCRELHHVATTASPSVFSRIPRPQLVYCAEPADSFYEYVYDPLLTTPPNQNHPKAKQDHEEGAPLSIQDAKRILEINDHDKDKDSNSSNGQLSNSQRVKAAFRRKAMTLHPDMVRNRHRRRNDNQELSTEDVAQEYALVRRAYDTLLARGYGQDSTRQETTTTNSSSALSFYESLGGRQRNRLWKIDMITHSKRIQQQRQVVDEKEIHNQDVPVRRSAIMGLDPSLVQSFVARSVSSSSSSK